MALSMMPSKNELIVRWPGTVVRRLIRVFFGANCQEMGRAGEHVETGAVKPLDKVTEGNRVAASDE
jgi:hypothetical protein